MKIAGAPRNHLQQISGRPIEDHLPGAWHGYLLDKIMPGRLRDMSLWEYFPAGLAGQLARMNRSTPEHITGIVQVARYAQRSIVTCIESVWFVTYPKLTEPYFRRAG